MASFIVDTENRFNTISEEEHIKNAVNGEQSSFKILYNKNSGKVFNFIKRISSNDDIATELTQRTFIKAWENLAEFKFNCSFRTWLQKIAVNEFLMEVRSNSRYAKRNIVYSESQREIHTPVVSEKMDIEKVISDLPHNQRLIFCLFHVEGYSIKEISALLEVSDGTVKSQLHDARKKLIKELQK